jgi:hypothetical protein
MHVAGIKHNGNFIIIIIIIVIIFITFIKDIHNYIPETNHFSRVYSFAAIE